MTDILQITNLSYDGADIGETQLAWIPEAVKQVINEQRRDGVNQILADLLPPEDQALFLENELIDYQQFENYHKQKTSLTYRSNPAHEKIKRYVTSFDDSYEGYLDYLQESKDDLTQFFFKWFRVKLPTSQVHTYIVGGTGSGKSELMKMMIYDRLQRAKSAVIVIDPKGDLSRQVARWRENARNPENLVLFDPELFSDLRPVINPLDIEDKSPINVQRAIFEMRYSFDQILSQIEGGFTPAMKNILGHTLSVLIRKGGSLQDLHRFFDSKRNKDLVEYGQQSTDEQDKAFFNGEFLDKGISVSTNGIRSRLGLLLQNQSFREITTGKSTIDLSQAIKGKKLIVFNLSKGLLTRDYSAFFGKLIVSLVLLEAMKNATEIEDEKKRPQIDIFIDEFQNFITPAVNEIVAEARAYGVRLTVATQMIGQDMDNKSQKLLMVNTDNKFVGYDNSDINRNAIHDQFGMKAKDLETKKRTFWAKIANGKPFKMKTRSTLAGHNNAMTAREWEEVKEYQKRYYRKPTKLDQAQRETIPEPPTPDTPTPPPTGKIKPKIDL